VEAAQIVDGAMVEGDIDERCTGFTAPRPLPSRIVDQETNALVARARNVEFGSVFSAPAIRLRDRHRPVVEPNDRFQEVPIEARGSGVHTSSVPARGSRLCANIEPN
jgi:hypothetical protein